MLLAGCTPVQPFQAGPPAPSQSHAGPHRPSLPAGPRRSPPAPRPGTPAATPPSSPYFAQPAPHPAPGGQASGGIAHIVVIVLENKAASQILGASEAGYFNKLAAEFSLAANYRAIMHPSLPNYLALTSGTNAGITSDCKPKSCTADVRSIADEITQSGRTWKMYAESMPAPCAARGLPAVCGEA